MIFKDIKQIYSFCVRGYTFYIKFITIFYFKKPKHEVHTNKYIIYHFFSKNFFCEIVF